MCCALGLELYDQVRLLSLQRRPLLFAHTVQAAQTALAQLQSSSPQMSGLVLVATGSGSGSGSPSDDKSNSSSMAAQTRNLDTDRLRILVLPDAAAEAGGSSGRVDQQDTFRRVERWMEREGLA